MEHLRLTTGEAPITIPYFSKHYDGGDFESYPSREGWDLSAWFEDDLANTAEDSAYLEDWIERCNPGKSVDEFGAFLQAWMFFGFLWTLPDFNAEPTAFVRHDESGSWLTTASLAMHIEQWQSKLQALESDSESKSEIVEGLKRIFATVDPTLALLSSVIPPNSIKDGRSHKKPHPIVARLEETLFVMILLIPQCREAAETALGISIRYLTLYKTTSMTPLLSRCMLEDGFCPFLVMRMEIIVGTEGQLRAFLLGSKRTSDDHNDCSPDFCFANNSSGSYTVQHVNLGCDCQMLSPSISDIVDIIHQDRVPVLHISQSKIIVNADTTEQPFIALSHLWADGLGNPSSNALPLCQVNRLEQYLRSFESQYNPENSVSPRPFALWSDTLCIPVDPKYQTERNLAISKMRQIYKNAHGVLVLDKDMEQIKEPLEPLDTSIKLLLSAWNSRLWTYQEAALARKLYIQTARSSFLFDELVDVLLTNTNVSLPDEFVDSVCSFAFRSKRYRDFKDASASGHENDMDGQMMIYAIQNRRTTRQDDESICIATYLGIDIIPILRALPSDRMKMLYLSLPFIPANMFFYVGKERMMEPGLRWAPVSFLQPTTRPLPPTSPRILKSLDNLNDSVERPLSKLHASNLGLLVFYPGVELTGAGGTPRLGQFIVHISDELAAAFSTQDPLDNDFSACLMDRLVFIVAAYPSNPSGKSTFSTVMAQRLDDKTSDGYEAVKYITTLSTQVIFRPDHPGGIGGLQSTWPRLEGRALKAQWWLVD